VSVTGHNRQAHWTAAQHVICYLHGTCDQNLILRGKQPIILRGHVDSDLAQYVDEWKSISGYSFDLGSRVISWSSKKQSTVASSSTEAEYVAADHTLKEAMWLCTLLSLIGYTPKEPTLILCENMGAISLIQNPVFHSHTKHIDVKHHYIQDHVCWSISSHFLFQSQHLLHFTVIFFYVDIHSQSTGVVQWVSVCCDGIFSQECDSVTSALVQETEVQVYGFFSLLLLF